MTAGMGWRQSESVASTQTTHNWEDTHEADARVLLQKHVSGGPKRRVLSNLVWSTGGG
jgi:hypothetical protein